MDNYEPTKFDETRLSAVVTRETALQCLQAIGREDAFDDFYHYGRDGRPFVATLKFRGDMCILDSSYREEDLAPGDNGVVTYQENVMSKVEYDDGSTMIAEQICFQSFLGILKNIDKNKIKL